MRYILLSAMSIGLVTLTACNDKADKATVAESSNKTVAIADRGNDTSQGSKELYAHYEHMVFALSNDNDKEAANAAKGIIKALATINHDELNDKDKVFYEDIVADMKEHAEHIADNVGNIAHQREHLVILSEDIYDIISLFGTPKPLYKIHCDMYNNRGAYWLSDSQEVKNPYYGERMLNCGVIQEEII